LQVAPSLIHCRNFTKTRYVTMKVGIKIYLLYFLRDVTCSCVINILEGAWECKYLQLFSLFVNCWYPAKTKRVLVKFLQ